MSMLIPVMDGLRHLLSVSTGVKFGKEWTWDFAGTATITAAVNGTLDLACGRWWRSFDRLLGIYTDQSETRCNMQLSTEDSCRPYFEIFGWKHVFAYFMLHTCLWIILEGARNIPIFSRYFWQHYQKIKLQFDVLKLRKKCIATHINNCNDVTAEGRCVRKCTLL